MEGNWAVSPDYDSVGWFWEGMASVQKDNKYCYIDKNGELAIDLNFDMAWHFSNDVAAVSINSMIGLIDKRGGWIVEPIYEDIAVPWSDLIGMQKNGKIGFIDTAGNVVIDFKFPRDPKRSLIYAYCFNNDRAAVIFDEDRPEYGIIDRSGNIVFTVVGGGIPYFEGDYVVTRDDNGRFVLIDINGGRHYLPPYFKYPPIGVNSTKDNIFRTWDTAGKDAKTGYFKIK
jgi:hypothetical protein